MADDFLGSVAQEDVQFVTGIVKTVNPGDNYKHLIVYTDDSQIASGASLAAVKDLSGATVAVYAEVTADSFKSVVTGELLVWLTDYFSAGGNESVFVVNVQNGESAYSKALLEAAFAVTHQWAYFKTICVADEDVATMFHLDPTAASDLAELCSTDGLLSSAPLYPMSMPVTGGNFTDTAYAAVKAAGFDAFWVYHLPVLQLKKYLQWSTLTLQPLLIWQSFVLQTLSFLLLLCILCQWLSQVVASQIQLMKQLKVLALMLCGYITFLCCRQTIQLMLYTTVLWLLWVLHSLLQMAQVSTQVTLLTW